MKRTEGMEAKLDAAFESIKAIEIQGKRTASHIESESGSKARVDDRVLSKLSSIEELLKASRG